MTRLGKKILIFSLVTSGIGVALAQDAGPPEHQTPAELPAADPDAPRARPRMTVAEMTQQVEATFERLAEIEKRMGQLRDVARREKDVIRLNCVADKMLQLGELREIAEQARLRLQEAVAAGDEEGRYHELSRVTVAGQQAQVLGGEGEACIGEDLTFIGATEVDVDEPALPDDPTVSAPPDFPVVEPLPVASPQR